MEFNISFLINYQLLPIYISLILRKDILIILKKPSKKLIEFYQFYFEFFYQFYFNIYNGNEISEIYQQKVIISGFYCPHCGLKSFTINHDENGSSIILDSTGYKYSDPEENFKEVLKIYKTFVREMPKNTADSQLVMDEFIANAIKLHAGVPYYKATVTEW